MGVNAFFRWVEFYAQFDFYNFSERRLELMAGMIASVVERVGVGPLMARLSAEGQALLALLLNYL